MATDPWADARNILCVRLDTLGDVLMTEPAMRALHESAPDRRLTLLTSPAGAEAAALIPEIDEVICYQAPWTKSNQEDEDPALDQLLLQMLNDRQYDAAVIFTVFSQSPLPAAYMCYLAQIPLRLAHCRENPYRLLTHWAPESEPAGGIRHEVQRQLDLVSTVGCSIRDTDIQIDVCETTVDAILQKLAGAGISLDQPWIAIHPGASAPSRRYPAELFAEAAQLLTERSQLQIVFTGAEEERELIESIRYRIPARTWSLAGSLDVSELAALISRAWLLISNNTGPAHLAAAVGTPVVDLYALTNPQHTPWQVPCRVLSFDVPCKYCFKSVCPQGHHDCLRKVAPQEVVSAALELLASSQIHVSV